jgi:hypothetical protein
MTAAGAELLGVDAAARMLLRAALNPADNRAPKRGDKRVTCFGVFAHIDNVDEDGAFVLAIDVAEPGKVAGKLVSAPAYCAWLAVRYQGDAS